MRFALELLPSLGLGLLLGRLFPGLPARLAPPLITWGVPISLVGLLLRSGLRADLVHVRLVDLPQSRHHAVVRAVWREGGRVI